MKIYAKLVLIPIAFGQINDWKIDDDIPDKYRVWYGNHENQQALRLHGFHQPNPSSNLRAFYFGRRAHLVEQVKLCWFLPRG